jgi:GT2 family glycosyltransferase
VTPDVTVVIPHYRADVLSDCLESLFAHTDLPFHVMVIDDGPDAPSICRARAVFPQIEILRNERNLGFCAACNRGLQTVRTRYAVLLNDDTRVTPGWLAPLLEAAERDPSIAACQPKLLSATDPDRFDYAGGAGGYIDCFGYTFCRGRLFDHREQDQGQYDRSAPLFWACGSAMFLRVEAVREVGLLDVDYFMHFEEIDLCWRLHLAGYSIAAVPASVVYHYSGFSLPPASFRKVYLNHRNNLVLLCKNLAFGRLLWIGPVRLGLELFTTFTSLLRGDWPRTAAPLAALLWCLFHPLQLLRRRRHSQSLRRVSDAAIRHGVYRGSIVFQYFARRVRAASQLIPEGGSA